MKQFKFALIAFVVALSTACASLPIKERAVRTLDSTERLLAKAQDAERQICNDAAFKANPTVPVMVCAGPLADAAQLTTAKHQAAARAFSRAFALQLKTTVVLRAWRAGDPIPQTLPDMMKAVEEITDVLQELVPRSEVVATLKTILQARKDLEALAAALKGAQ